MRFGSVCSGIEAASCAWGPLGYSAAWVAEVEPFCCALLKHHYPEVPNHGDFTTIQKSEPIDVLVGGTPCQSFSVAGKRAGLDDARGNLTLEFLALAGRLRPGWVVWENVPGVLSDDGGRTFGTVLGLLGQLGYGFAYRVLDAQYFGVPQRRRRVFVVGHLGDWRPAAAVLFERYSLQGHPAPGRAKGQGVAPTLESGTNRTGVPRPPGSTVDTAESLVSFAVNAKGGCGRLDGESETFITAPLTQNPYGDHESRESLLITHSLRADGFDASEDGTGRGTPLVASAIGQRMRGLDDSCANNLQVTAFSSKDHGADAGELAPTLRAMHHDKSHANAGGQIAVAGVLAANSGRLQVEQTYVTQQTAVRRLTPRECERLQGFPDDYTQIPYRGKPAADGPRYRALGNSMAVPVMAWIGKRILEVAA